MIRTRSALAALSALVVSTTPILALESTLTAKSSLSPEVLWQTVSDFCRMALWHPTVAACIPSAEGKVRTLSLIGGNNAVEVLENWDGANRNYTYTSVSPLPVVNYRSKVSVTADGKGSALQLSGTYEANGVPDADAKKAVDRGMFRALCVSGPLRCSNNQQQLVSSEIVAIPDSLSPLTLQGYLRRSKNPGPSPAVVLLHGCASFADQVDEDWAERIASWGYVTLTIDSFGRRGVKSDCGAVAPSDTGYDPYRGLNYLIKQNLVDPRRVAIVGFGSGGFRALSAVARGTIEYESEKKFRAAAAFYPACGLVKGPMTIPTLILIGELDDWTTPDACRKLADGTDDQGMSRARGEGAAVKLIVYPNTYAGFDLSDLKTPILYSGHRLQFNKTATEQSSESLREFLNSMLGGFVR
jgi:dienelactone hydrolase